MFRTQKYILRLLDVLFRSLAGEVKIVFDFTLENMIESTFYTLLARVCQNGFRKIINDDKFVDFSLNKYFVDFSLNTYLINIK